MAVAVDFSSVIECFAKFQTDSLDAAWLKSSWEGDHFQLDVLPVEFEELHEDTDWKSILRQTCIEVRCLIAQNGMAGKDKAPVSAVPGEIPMEEGPSEDSSDTETEGESASSFWLTLVEHGISVKGVVIIAGCFIVRGSSRTSQFLQSDVALQAACLYLCMVCIPGSRAFRLFHPVLYQKAMDLLTLTKRFNNANDGRGSAGCGAGNRKHKSAKTHVQQKARTVGGRNMGDGDEDCSMASEHDDSIQERSDTEDDILTVKQMKSLLDSMRQFLLDLILLLKSFSLKHDAQSLEHTILRLSEFLNHEGKSAVDLGSLSTDIHTCLMVLCTQFHGSINTTITAVMKRMFNMLLLNANLGIIKCVCHLMTDIPHEKALPGARILIQNMCVKAPERADARNKASSVILVLIDHLTPPAFFSIVEWFLRFARNPKVNSRIFALEILALILGRKPSDRPLLNFRRDNMHNLSCQCLHAVLARCSDIAATVRSKALAILANCVTTENSLAYGAVLKIFAPSQVSQIGITAASLPTPSQRIDNATLQQTGSVRQQDGVVVSFTNRDQEKMPSLNCPVISEPEIPAASSDMDLLLSGRSQSSQETPSDRDGSGTGSLQVSSFSSDLPTLNAVMELLRNRASDKKVHVRKAAIQVLQRAMELNPDCLSYENIQTLQERCLDTSILVKKQSMQALTAILLSYPTQGNLQQAWLRGILPSIVDPENSIQEKCVEMVDDVLLKNIVVHSQSVSSTHVMTWVMMNEIAHNEDHLIKSWRFMQRACFYMARSGKLRKNLIQVLQSHINTENDDATWLLLSGLAQCMDIKNSNFVFSYWDMHQHEIENRSTTLINALKVMSAICKHSDETTVTKYFASLSVLLEELSCPYKIITTLVETIVKLSEANKSKKTTSSLHNVCGSVFKKCDRYLTSVFLNEANKVKAIDEDSTIRHFTAMAEVAMVYPKLSSERICIILKSIMASKCSTPQAVENVAVLASQETQPSQRLVKFGPGALSQRLQNFALVALGKLCLQNETLAKECTPALGRMLETSTDSVARNNIVVILVDLCVRYTTMVDPYFPSVTACLKDHSFMVRNQTLTLLTHLLQEDYIKWRGSLFFCFVTALVDPSPVIRTFTEHALLHILTKRHPTMLFQHFVECLFFFNAYQDHPMYNNITQSEKEAKLFSLVGDKNVEKRMTLYKFMLVNMADEHRFQVTAKLCQDILGGTVHNMIKLKRTNGTLCVNGQNLVRDTLAILSSDEIKLATLRNTVQDELEDVDVAAAVLATAKKTVVSQVVKKNVIENIVPILISLKHKLEKLHSPLLKDLMIYLKELMRGDFKLEVKEVLDADKQLSAEIEYDLKKFDQAQAAEQLHRGNAMTPQPVEDQNNVANPLENMDPKSPARTVKQAGSALQSAIATNNNPDISMLPIVQLERLDISILKDQRAAISNDSKATLYDERMAETVINSPAPPRTMKRRLSNASGASKLQEKKQASKSGPSTKHALHRIPVRRLEPLESQEKPGPASDHAAAAALVPKAEPVSPGGSNGVGVPRTPAKRALENSLLRAISTPCGVITDITFRMPSGNLSPIANQFPEDMVLHVMNPERATAQPSAYRAALAPLLENDEMDSSS